MTENTSIEPQRATERKLLGCHLGEPRNSVERKVRGKIVRLDSCITEVVADLNKLGMPTLASCCGHGIYPPSVVIKIDGGIEDFYSKKVLTGQKYFYKTDSKGFYFIHIQK